MNASRQAADLSPATTRPHRGPGRRSVLVAGGLDIAQAVGFGAAAWWGLQWWRAASTTEAPTDPALPAGIALCAGSLALYAVEAGIIGAALLRTACTGRDDTTITSMVSLAWLHLAGILAIAAIQATTGSTTLTVKATAFGVLALIHALSARTLTATYRPAVQPESDTPSGDGIRSPQPRQLPDRSQAESWRDLL